MFDTLFKLSKEHELTKSTIELPETPTNSNKKAPEGANFINGGRKSSYIEQYIIELKEHLYNKSSARLLFLLDSWYNKKVA